ncbi:5'-deoxynucleotidase [Rheinheimera riviphila]|uniref:5'-deoxynucleotidase n=1 Tax=Rheinheimera riviphila TaxID=1834037 RepID=A0A437QBL8_9GAMM|nr:5'-deoxynucleotidase [Rheinheimera riviphila]RVU31897.1 5'-deoxynucleotidase [Rheinheimera riviphila]
MTEPLQSHFFAHLFRMKLINRWPLMRNVNTENVAEHSHQVAMVAHMLAVIGQQRFGKNLSPERLATLALYHDASEVITGDLPTPVKYFNPQIAIEYKKIEAIAEQRLLALLPTELQQVYQGFLLSTSYTDEEKLLVKAADHLCAYVKTIEEISAGNHEFTIAKRRLEKILLNYPQPEVKYFLDTFTASFALSLDEISQDEPQ